MSNVSSLFEIIQLSWRSFSFNDLSNACSSFSSSHFLEDFKSYINNNSSIRYLITFYVTTNDHVALSQLNALTTTINRAMTKIESRDSYFRIDERFLFTLETHIRESSNSLSSWFLTLEMQLNNNLLSSFWFNETIDEHVVKLIYLYVRRLSTNHRFFLKDIKIVNFSHNLVQLAIKSSQIDSYLRRNILEFRFRWILSECVRR